MKNPTDFLVAATQLPAAIEARLPAGAPKISAFLVDTAAKLPKVPDFPMEIPDLPAPPMFPEMPALPGLGRMYVSGVEVTPTPAQGPAKPVAVSPEREKIPLVFE